jgi:transposase
MGRYDVCWIDPGVINFMTVMDEDGIEVYGDEIVAGAAAKAHHDVEYDPREHHLLLANHLAESYKNIIIPELDPTLEKRLSQIGLERRSALGHRSFYRRLRRACRRTGSRYIVTAEHETSMKCCVCGNLNPFQSKGRVVSCNVCNAEMDRDVNGVRNIGSRFVGIARHNDPILVDITR